MAEGKERIVGPTNDQLMDEVRKYPVIYDRFSKDFKDKFKKMNAWTEISNSMKFNLRRQKKDTTFEIHM